MHITVYPENRFDQYSFDYENGILDLSAWILVMGDNFLEDHSAHHTTPVQATEYFIFASCIHKCRIKQNMMLDFLTAPFSLSVWILTIFSMIFMFLLEEAVPQHNTTANYFKWYSRHGIFVASLGCIYLTLAYSSNLKALLAVPTEMTTSKIFTI